MNKELIERLVEQAVINAVSNEIENGTIPPIEIQTPSEAWTIEYTKLIVAECVNQIVIMQNNAQQTGTPPGYDYDSMNLAYNDCIDSINNILE